MAANVGHRGPVDRFIDGIEMTAAIFLAAVTALTFVSVLLRYIFIWTIPDSYDLSSLGLGILIFWGIASASYRGEHITVDLLHGAVGPKLKRVIDTFASLVTLVCLLVFTWMVAIKVLNPRAATVAYTDGRGIPHKALAGRLGSSGVVISSSVGDKPVVLRSRRD